MYVLTNAIEDGAKPCKSSLKACPEDAQYRKFTNTYVRTLGLTMGGHLFEGGVILESYGTIEEGLLMPT